MPQDAANQGNRADEIIRSGSQDVADAAGTARRVQDGVSAPTARGDAVGERQRAETRGALPAKAEDEAARATVAVAQAADQAQITANQSAATEQVGVNRAAADAVIRTDLISRTAAANGFSFWSKLSGFLHGAVEFLRGFGVQISDGFANGVASFFGRSNNYQETGALRAPDIGPAPTLAEVTMDTREVAARAAGAAYSADAATGPWGRRDGTPDVRNQYSGAAEGTAPTITAVAPPMPSQNRDILANVGPAPALTLN